MLVVVTVVLGEMFVRVCVCVCVCMFMQSNLWKRSKLRSSVADLCCDSVNPSHTQKTKLVGLYSNVFRTYLLKWSGSGSPITWPISAVRASIHPQKHTTGVAMRQLVQAQHPEVMW